MSLVSTLEMAATILGGVVSGAVILGFVVDFFTRGWVKRHVRHWLGIEQLRGDHHATQTFLSDLGRAFNELRGTVCEEHDIPAHQRPASVKTDRYDDLLEGEDEISSGDFIVDD